MKTIRHTLLPIIALFICSNLALAQDAGIWDKMKNKLEKITPQKKTVATTAVGGVRAAKDQSGDTLYWKDEDLGSRISEGELASFKAAYQDAEAGQKESATGKFSDFIKTYPQSPLRADAEAAIKALQEK